MRPFNEGQAAWSAMPDSATKPIRALTPVRKLSWISEPRHSGNQQDWMTRIPT